MCQTYVYRNGLANNEEFQHNSCIAACVESVTAECRPVFNKRYYMCVVGLIEVFVRAFVVHERTENDADCRTILGPIVHKAGVLHSL